MKKRPGNETRRGGEIRPVVSNRRGTETRWRDVDRRSDPGGLASLAEALQFLAPAALAGLFIVSLAPHLLAKTATFAKFPETADRLLDRLAGTDP
jgi:hypothetical protein